MLSIVLPTKNRPDFVRRALQYYSKMRFQGPIYIADSSDAEHAEQMQRVLESSASQLKIVHCAYPSDGIAVSHYKAAQAIGTKYVANTTDAAFLVSSALERCVAFLEHHPDYVAAHGRVVTLSLCFPGAYGAVNGVRPLLHRSIEGETASARLMDHLSHYSEILYSVYRTETWRTMWAHAHLPMTRALAGEMLPSCLAVVLGKVKQLDCLSLVRQSFQQRASLPDPHDEITGLEWSASYHAFREQLTQALVRQDRITVAEAQEVIKQAFWAYLAKWMGRVWQVRYARRKAGIVLQARTALRERLRVVPWLRWTWRMVTSHLPGEAHAMSLFALLRPSSPYHRDFLPIYQTITQQQQELSYRTIASSVESSIALGARGRQW